MTIWQWPFVGENAAAKNLRMGVGSIAGLCAFFVYPCTSYLAMLTGGPLTEKSYLVAMISFSPLILALIFFKKFKYFAFSALLFIVFVISVFGNFLFETEIRELITKSTQFYSEHSVLPTYSERENSRLTVTPIGNFAYEISSPDDWSTEVQFDIFNTQINYSAPGNDVASLVFTCFDPNKKGADIPTLTDKIRSSHFANTGFLPRSECYRSKSGIQGCLIQKRLPVGSLNWSLYLSDDHAEHGLKVSVKTNSTNDGFKTELVKSLSSIRFNLIDRSIGECHGTSRLTDFPSS